MYEEYPLYTASHFGRESDTYLRIRTSLGIIYYGLTLRPIQGTDLKHDISNVSEIACLC
jgi:hypothetical protein